MGKGISKVVEQENQSLKRTITTLERQVSLRDDKIQSQQGDIEKYKKEFQKLQGDMTKISQAFKQMKGMNIWQFLKWKRHS